MVGVGEKREGWTTGKPSKEELDLYMSSKSCGIC